MSGAAAADHKSLYVTIMAGGSGTRFWPLSRRARPKHLLPVFGGVSLLQQAVARALTVAEPSHILVVTRADQIDQCRSQVRDLGEGAFLAEPVGRDTAMCLAFAAAVLGQQDPQAVMLAAPADHAIRQVGEFRRAVLGALEMLDRMPEKVVVFGIRPDRPATGYGYIERGDELETELRDGVPAYHVRRFHEKPDADTAEEYLRAGRFYWNSGMFLWRVERFLDLLEKHAPEVAKAARSAAAAWRSDEAAFRRAYESAPRTSIDFALMERIPEHTVMIEAPFDWDDLGSWQALARHFRTNERGTTAIGRFAGIDAGDLIVYAEGGVVAAVGVEGLIIVHTPDATFVCRADEEARLKELVRELEERGWEDVL